MIVIDDDEYAIKWEAETDKLFCLASATGFLMSADKHASSEV
jgi:hypothetical protein